MHFKIFAFLLLLAVDVSPSLGKETNASRFKRGLPPLPPQFLLRNKRATATISAQPSYTPRPQLSARSSRIQVFAGNGSSLGYVKKSTPIFGINLDTDNSQDLRVQTVTEKPFAIVFESPNFLSASLYSGVITSGVPPHRDFTENQARHATVSNKGLVRTAVWSIDSTTKELKARYVDLNGAESPVIAFDAVGNQLLFVGHIDVFNAARHDFSAIPVRLYLDKD